MGEEPIEVTELRTIRRRDSAGRSPDVLRLLDGEGPLRPEEVMADEAAVRALQSLVSTRLLSTRLAELHAAGRVGYHPPVDMEATPAVATAEALTQEGWLFPGNRHLAAFVHRGVTFERYLDHAFGNRGDATAGHQMPGFYTARAERIASVAGPTMGHLTHAPGFCWAARQRGDEAPVAVLFGEAAVESAEYHTGVNFAGVMKAPVVFVALSRGRREPSIAETGIAYGVAARKVDGGDLFAVVHAVREAISSEVPVILEALLEPEQPGETRLRTYLERRGAWSDDRQAALDSEVRQGLDEAVSRAAERSAPDRASMFEHVFAKLPPHLEAQEDELRNLSRRS